MSSNSQGSICTQPLSALPLFSRTTWPRALFAIQPAGVIKEACLYAGADWLSSSVSQRVARGHITITVHCSELRSPHIAGLRGPIKNGIVSSLSPHWDCVLQVIHLLIYQASNHFVVCSCLVTVTHLRNNPSSVRKVLIL